MAHIHQSLGWEPPDGKRLTKSSYTRSAKGIEAFVIAVRTLAREYNAKYSSYR